MSDDRDRAPGKARRELLEHRDGPCGQGRGRLASGRLYRATCSGPSTHGLGKNLRELGDPATGPVAPVQLGQARVVLALNANATGADQRRGGLGSLEPRAQHGIQMLPLEALCNQRGLLETAIGQGHIQAPVDRPAPARLDFSVPNEDQAQGRWGGEAHGATKGHVQTAAGPSGNRSREILAGTLDR